MYLYSALYVVPHSQGAQTFVNHTVLLAITPLSAFTSQAFTRWRLLRLRLRTSNCSLLIIYLPRKDERLSRPGWLTYSGRFTHIIVTHQLQVERRAGFAGQRPTFYHCTTQPTRNQGSVRCATTSKSIHFIGTVYTCSFISTAHAAYIPNASDVCSRGQNFKAKENDVHHMI